MEINKNFVTLKGFKDGKYLVVYCPYCDRFHRHGFGDGLRTPHCSQEVKKKIGIDGYNAVEEKDKKEAKKLKEKFEKYNP